MKMEYVYVIYQHSKLNKQQQTLLIIVCVLLIQHSIILDNVSAIPIITKFKLAQFYVLLYNAQLLQVQMLTKYVVVFQLPILSLLFL